MRMHSRLQTDDAIPVQKPSSSSIKISSLPSELLIGIADYLQQLRDANSFAQSSRHIYQSLGRHLLWRSREFILLAAVLQQTDELLETALQLKPIVNQRDVASGHTPISLAIQFGHTSKVRLLLGVEGIYLHSKDTEWQRTPLEWAVKTDNLECIHLLLGHPDMTAYTANEGFCMAVDHNKFEAVRVFIDHDVDLNMIGSTGDTPVAIAMQLSYLKMSNFFVNECHVNYTRRTRGDRTLVLDSICCGDLDLFKRVVDKSPKAFIHLPDGEDWTPLLWATNSGHIEIADFLLSLGADPCISTSRGLSALVAAAEKGYEELIRKMIEHGADPNFYDGYRQTPLMHAAQGNHIGTIRILLNAPGIDINQGDGEGVTALMHAAKDNRIDAVRALLDAPGIDINKRDCKGWSAYIFARCPRFGRNREVEDLLVARGADTLRRARLSQLHHRSMWARRGGRFICGTVKYVRRSLP